MGRLARSGLRDRHCRHGHRWRPGQCCQADLDRAWLDCCHVPRRHKCAYKYEKTGHLYMLLTSCRVAFQILHVRTMHLCCYVLSQICLRSCAASTWWRIWWRPSSLVRWSPTDRPSSELSSWEAGTCSSCLLSTACCTLSISVCRNWRWRTAQVRAQLFLSWQEDAYRCIYISY